jgi:hypothetical protein
VLTATNGPALRAAELVDRLGDELLAGARFAEHQDRQIVAQDAGDHAVDVLHRLAAADQRQALPRVVALPPSPPVASAAWQAARTEIVEIERLGKVLESSGLGGADRGVERVLRRQDDHRHFGMGAMDLAERGDPVAVGSAARRSASRRSRLREQAVAPGDAVAAVDVQRLGLEPAVITVAIEASSSTSSARLVIPCSSLFRHRQVNAEMRPSAGFVALVADAPVHVATSLLTSAKPSPGRSSCSKRTARRCDRAAPGRCPARCR